MGGSATEMLAELSIRREMAHPESYLGFLGRNQVGAEGKMKTRIINGNRLGKIKKESRWGMTTGEEWQWEPGLQSQLGWVSSASFCHRLRCDFDSFRMTWSRPGWASTAEAVMSLHPSELCLEVILLWSIITPPIVYLQPLNRSKLRVAYITVFVCLYKFGLSVYTPRWNIVCRS